MLAHGEPASPNQKMGRSRRSVLVGTASTVLASGLVSDAPANTAGAKGYVLGAAEGEHLIQRGGNIFIKADPTKGSGALAMGTQQILAGVGIPVHRHFEMDEAF
jgi:hypothetical protein